MLDPPEIERIMQSDKEQLALCGTWMTEFSLDDDVQLVSYVNEVCDRGWMTMQCEDMNFDRASASKYTVLSSKPVPKLRVRCVAESWLCNARLGDECSSCSPSCP